VNRIAKFYWILLVPAGLLTFACSFLGLIGFAWGLGWFGWMFVLAFPLFLFIFVSLRLAVLLLWLDVASILVVHFVYGRATGINSWIYTAAILTQVAYIVKKRWQLPEIRSVLAKFLLLKTGINRKVFWVTFFVLQSIGAILALTSLRAHLASFLWPVIAIAPFPFTAVCLSPGIQISGFVLDILFNPPADRHIVVVAATVLIAIMLNAFIWRAVALLGWKIYSKLKGRPGCQLAR